MENETLQVLQACADGIQSSGSRVRLVIVEDMQFLADTLCHLCQQTWGMEVVAVSYTGAQGYGDIIRTKPDVVLLDLGLPDTDGVTLAGKINISVPTARIIVISAALSDYQLHRLGEVVFQGVVDKFAEGLMDLRHAISLVNQGGSYFSSRYLMASRRLRHSDTAFFKRLSLREQEVMMWAAQALSDEEIATRLDLSVTTAQTHRREIMRKLNIHSTPKLIRYGMELGMCIGTAYLEASK